MEKKASDLDNVEPAERGAFIEEFQIKRFEFKRDRVIGDAQISVDHCWIGVLELFSRDGLSGLGWFFAQQDPLPAERALTELFQERYFANLQGRCPESVLNKLTRHRGGMVKPHPFALDQGINQALWDMAAKRANLPLFRYLGGEKNRVPIYGSGLCFHLSDKEFTALYERMASLRCVEGYKVKVGHKDLARDIRRLKLAREIVGADCRLMIDANESWSPKEAIYKVRKMQDAGIDVFWVEDPVVRTDIEGMIDVKRALTDVFLNTTEYMDIPQKTQAVERNAVDIVNIHGDISGSMRIAWLCAEHGLPVSIGNTMMEVGAHLAAALPEVIGAEYSFQNTDQLLEVPLHFEDGCLVLSERPGHGLAVSAAAEREFRG